MDADQDDDEDDKDADGENEPPGKTAGVDTDEEELPAESTGVGPHNETGEEGHQHQAGLE